MTTPTHQSSQAGLAKQAAADGSERYFIGIDLGGTHIKAGLLDNRCNTIHTDTADTPYDSRPQAVADRIVDLAKSLAEHAGVDAGQIGGVGVGVPGLIDSDSGVVKACVNLKDWDDVPLREMIASATGKPTIVDNDANAAAFGEFSMALQETPNLKHLSLITLGTGVGAGVVLNRRVFHGGGGLAGEVGHMIAVPDGHLCACGQRGCLEQYASATAMVRVATERIATGKRSRLALALGAGEKLTTRHIFAAAAEGDRLAISIIEDTAKYLAISCINLCRMVDLQMIVIGGGVANAGNALLLPLRAAFQDQTWAIDGACEPTIEVSTLGNTAGYIGAASLVMAHVGEGLFA